MARRNKVYLHSRYLTGTGAARQALDLPRHIQQVNLIAIAPTKVVLANLLTAHYGRTPYASDIREFRVNDSFATWQELSSQGILSSDGEPGLYMTEMSAARTLVQMLSRGEARVIARGSRSHDRSGPLGERIWTLEQA